MRDTRQDWIDAATEPAVDSLRALRQAAGKAQADIAAALHIKQPSVSKLENQADMHLSTLRSYIAAIGGELELVVRWPSRPAVRLHQPGTGSPAPAGHVRSRTARPTAPTRTNRRT
jgi:DNA-binding XRE family transcriptional regulator